MNIKRYSKEGFKTAIFFAVMAILVLFLANKPDGRLSFFLMCISISISFLIRSFFPPIGLGQAVATLFLGVSVVDGIAALLGSPLLGSPLNVSSVESALGSAFLVAICLYFSYRKPKHIHKINK